MLMFFSCSVDSRVVPVESESTSASVATDTW